METKTKTTKAKVSKAKAPKKAVKAVAADALQAKVWNVKGKEAGSVALPSNIFGLPWNANLVHQVVISMQANNRTPIAHTKDRSEVSGGGKKPWRQKGTGRARHGSTRSPIWVHGGVAHGPRNEKDYSKKINRKMREKALLVSLSRKYKDGEVIFVDSLELEQPKAATAKVILASLSGAGFPALTGKKKNAALIALPATHRSTMKSFSNFGNVSTVDIHDLNPVAVLGSKYLIIASPESALEVLGKKRVVKASK